MLYQSRRIRRNNPHLNPKHQQGVVIVVALFVVALVAAMSYVMMARLMRDTQRTTLMMRHAQAEFYAQGSIAWALDQLRNDWERQRADQLIDVIPIRSPVSDMHGYKIESTIEDMQSRFNLNNISAPEWQVVFLRLLQLAVPGISLADAQGIVIATVDWIMPGGGQSELSQYYLSLPVPYRQAHRLMQSPSELRLVKGVTPGIYNALLPYITALPVVTPVNVQTASPVVIAAMSATMPMDAAKVIERFRQQKPFVNQQVFIDLDVVKNHPIKPDLIVVVSQYFLLQTKVSIENQQSVIYTLLERVANDRKAVVNILWQSKGVW